MNGSSTFPAVMKEIERLVVLDLMRDLLRRGWAYAVPAGPGREKIYFCVDGVRS